MASVNPGKRFERSFKASMDAVGYALRIPDRCFLAPSGRLLSEPSEGDFLFFAENGRSYLVECKATAQASFPFASLRPEQEAELLRFDAVGPTTTGLVALNYYGESLRRRNALYLLPIRAYLAAKGSIGRKSLPESVAAEVGTPCPRAAGGIWALPLQEAAWD